MILIDFGIICIGQTTPSIPPISDSMTIEVYKRTINSDAQYNEDYNFHTADTLIGYWYIPWLRDELVYEESLFDISEKGCPWVYVVPKFKDTVRSFLEFYLNESPEHKIAVLLRIQDKSNDTVHSVCKIDEFMNALTDGNIRWNELYFIEK
ncbi:MAG: hypothetical protein IJ368_06835 [Oscillospiraceae bacterium]|nr:hypothetical protein [Oscillospiraceae bacterium]